MEETYSGYSRTSPTLGVCIVRQQNSSVRSSSLLSWSFPHQDISKYCSRCSSLVHRRCMSVVLFHPPKMLATKKNTRRTTLSSNMILFLLKTNEQTLVWIISRQCFVFVVISSTMGILATVIGDVFLFHHQLLKLQLQVQCHSATRNLQCLQ